MRTAALAAILILAPFAAGLPTDPPAWEITDETTFEGVPLVLAQDVVVRPGGSLRLLGVDAIAARGIEVRVMAGGALSLGDGVSVLTGAVQPTRLVSAASPFDLVVEAGASFVARNATLQGARPALAAGLIEKSHLALSGGALRVTGGEVVIESSVLDASPEDLARVEAGTLRVRNSTLQGAGGAALSARPGSTLHAHGSTVGQTGDYGVRAESASIVIEDVMFTTSTSYSVYALASSARIANSSFTAHCGAFLVQSTGSFEGNDVRAMDHGATLVSSPVMLLANNTFRGTQEALLLVTSNALVRDNEFIENGRGAVLHRSSPLMERNVFAANQGGVEVAGLATSAPILRDNAFGGNAIFALSNAQPSSVDARWNWWGAASGPGAGDITGPVDVSPWLAAAP